MKGILNVGRKERLKYLSFYGRRKLVPVLGLFAVAANAAAALQGGTGTSTR